MNILDKANDIINKRAEEKQREYGPFIECNEKCAKIASLISGRDFTTEDVYFIQIALKLARSSYSYKEDTLLDLVAYIGAYNNFKNNIEP